MNWIEVKPLPEVCRKCTEEDCYNCDMAGYRWEMSEQAQLRLRRNVIRKELERLTRELSEIESKLTQQASQSL